MLMNIVIFIFICVSFYLMHTVGRKTIIVTGFTLTAFSSALVTFGYANTSSSSSTWILIGIMMYMMTYGASLGPVGWAYIPEVVPPSAISYIVACNWLSYGLVALLFPIITQHLLGGNPCLMFLIFTVISVIGALFNWRYMIETKDKTEKAIREEYKAIKVC
jgi:hypothetical protein